MLIKHCCSFLIHQTVRYHLFLWCSPMSSPSSLTTTTSLVGSMLKTNSRYDISMFHSISATRAYTLGISDRLIGLIPYRIPCAFLLWLKKEDKLQKQSPYQTDSIIRQYLQLHVVYIFKGNISTIQNFKQTSTFLLHIYYNSTQLNRKVKRLLGKHVPITYSTFKNFYLSIFKKKEYITRGTTQTIIFTTFFLKKMLSFI